MEKLPAITDQFEGDAAEVIPTTGSKKRGRRPGSGKVPGSGRKPGSKNKVPPNVREMILVRGKPIELLCDISRGVRVRVGPQAGPGEPQYAYPSLQERAAAAKILLDKLVPAAPAGAPAQQAPQADTAPEMSDIDCLRRVRFLMTRSMPAEDRAAYLAAKRIERIAPTPTPPVAGGQPVDDPQPGIASAATPEPAEYKPYSTYEDVVAAQKAEDRLARAEQRLSRPVAAYVEPGGSFAEHGREPRHRSPNVVRFEPR